ncbi:unnamed protein product [Lota lota]
MMAPVVVIPHATPQQPALVSYPAHPWNTSARILEPRIPPLPRWESHSPCVPLQTLTSSSQRLQTIRGMDEPRPILPIQSPGFGKDDGSPRSRQWEPTGNQPVLPRS